MTAEDSFREYVSARLTALSRIAYLLTGDRHLAEDLVQVTLMKVAGHWTRIHAAGDPDAYVRRALYNEHVSWWRRRQTRAVPYAVLPDRALSDQSSAVTTSLAVRGALARLAPRQRAVLVLRYFEDLSEAQAAAALGCTVGTVKSQTRDALARLRLIAPELSEFAGGSKTMTMAPVTVSSTNGGGHE